jgi:cellulose biosynthesis protein BcsQ
MRVFAVISGKGGTGKTLFSVAISNALSNLIRFTEEPEPKILMVDMDFHVRGLTLLMHRDLSAIKRAKVSTYKILEDMPPDGTGVNLSDELIKKELEVAKNITVLPATDLSGDVDWNQIHKWNVQSVVKRLRNLIRLAESAGFNIVLFDTRAGPDRLSLGASISADYTFLLLEQDIVSSRITLPLVGEIDQKRKEVGDDKDLTDLPVSRLGLVPSKTVLLYSEETKRILRDFTFLSEIPFDLDFLTSYYTNPFEMVRGKILNTRLGRDATKTLLEALQSMFAPYELIVPKPALETKSESVSPWVVILRSVPPTFTFSISFLLFAIAAMQSYFPQFLQGSTWRLVVSGGFVFVIMTLVIMILRRFDFSKTPILYKDEPNGSKEKPQAQSKENK